ncbi:MAG: hypothetical protein SCK29_13000 [Bacillota bacterium]|nr:hypothetical protein [Bacillota bacterium]
MKNVNQIVVLILGIVLISNLVVLQQVNQTNKDIVNLRVEIASIRNETQNSINTVGSMVRNAINDISEETRWVTPVEVSLGQEKQDKQEINLSWQIKDYTEGSQVYFYYRKADTSPFERVPAENIAGGSFRANIEVSLDFEPELMIESDSDIMPPTEREATEAKIKEEKFKTQRVYDYYIEVQDGNSIKTSEQARFDLGKFRHLGFAWVRVNIARVDNDSYSFTVYEETSYDNIDNKLEEVFLKQDGANRVPLVKEITQQGRTIFIKTFNLDEPAYHADLILKYDTGKIITKKINRL